MEGMGKHVHWLDFDDVIILTHMSRVMAMATKRVVYVSCNPATLARDLGHMHQDYDIVEIQPVDMFPHTFHVESVVKLVRRR